MRLLPLAAALALSACTAQRFPSPMAGPEDLPPGMSDLLAEGPEEALLIRHGDTVHVKRAGEASPYVLHFYDKQARIRAGAAVYTDAGGRAELFFPQGARAELLGAGAVAVGSPSRGEPLLTVFELDTLSVVLAADESVRLPGGARLSGAGGPYRIAMIGPETMSLRHRGRTDALVEIRDQELLLSPGDVLHLPILQAGTAPRQVDPDVVERGRVGATPLRLSASAAEPGLEGAATTLRLGAGERAAALGLELEGERAVRLAPLESAGR
jgi:hypothetical protein